MIHIGRVLCGLLWLLTGSVSVVHAEDNANAELEALANQIKTINYRLDRGNFDQDALASWTKVAIKLQGEASVCIDKNEEKIEKIGVSLESLGEKVEGEKAEVTKQRETLQQEKEELDKLLAQCNVYKQTSDKASEHISLAEKSYFKEKYLVRGPHIYTLIIAYLKNPFELITESGEFFWKHTGLQEIDVTRALISIIAIFIMSLIGIWIRKFLFKLERSYEWIDDYSERFLRAALTTIAHYLPWLLGTATAALILTTSTSEISPTPFITTLSVSLLIFFGFITLVRFIFTPIEPAQPFIDYSPGIAEKLARRLRVFAVLVFVGYMAFYTVFSQSIPELNRLLLRDIFSLLVVLNLIWFFMVL
ncbi:MAG: hypothetical protein PVF35_04775, partial [Gammaproteobacteria bacterium]